MFYSILFPSEEKEEENFRETPSDCLQDLNLDQVFQNILKKENKYHLDKYFYTPVKDIDTVYYRQNIFRDLEKQELYDIFQLFSQNIYEVNLQMRSVYQDLNAMDRMQHSYLAKGKFLSCAETYCENLESLLEKLKIFKVESEGFAKAIEFIEEYYYSDAFQGLLQGTRKIRDIFSKLSYEMMIKNGTIHVRKYEGAEDLSKIILNHFQKFNQGSVKDYHHKNMNEGISQHIESEILYLLQRVYPEEFQELNQYVETNLNFVHPVLCRFCKEIRFYFAWLEYIKSIKESGLSFCYPKVSTEKKEFYADDFFDIVLAKQIGSTIVANDFTLTFPERILVVTGPNQGGKTTFARAFGQLHYLASLGLTIPGTKAEILFTDQVFTHFDREEDLEELCGKLQDDLERLHFIVDHATENSVIVINEIFSSTTVKDALVLGKQMMDMLTKVHSVSVIVTFLDELAFHGDDTVSMTGEVEETNSQKRTFKIKRNKPDGMAYAMTIARNHKLTYEQIIRRLNR